MRLFQAIILGAAAGAVVAIGLDRGDSYVAAAGASMFLPAIMYAIMYVKGL